MGSFIGSIVLLAVASVACSSAPPIERPAIVAPAPVATQPPAPPAPSLDAVRALVAASPHTRAFAFTRGEVGERAFAGGAVEDATGVTVCWIELVEDARVACYREAGASLVAGGALALVDLDSPSLAVPLSVEGTHELRVFAQTAGAALEAPWSPPPPNDALLASSPWARTAVEENRERRDRARGIDRSALRSLAATDTEVPLWVGLLRGTPLDATVLFRARDQVVVATLEGDGFEVEREGTLFHRSADVWRASRSEPVTFDAARPSDALRPNTLAALTRPNDVAHGSSTDVPYADVVTLVVLEAQGAELVPIAELAIGENGFVRDLDYSHTWRVFNNVSVVASSCVSVARDHAWSARFTRGNVRFGPERPFAPVSDGDFDALAYYDALPGSYRLEPEGFVRASCP